MYFNPPKKKKKSKFRLIFLNMPGNQFVILIITLIHETIMSIW